MYVSTKADITVQPKVITVLADSDYYSKPDPSRTGPPCEASRWEDYGIPLPVARKTGLGSSAALVTALVAGLLRYYSPQAPFDISSDGGRARLHHLAQAAHAAAQERIGSGFDVAAAIYGSCLYRRYSASVVQDVVSPFDDLRERLERVVDDADSWNDEIDTASVRLPRRIRIVLCDVRGGSKSVQMARTVLRWRENVREDADVIWGALRRHNNRLVQLLGVVADLADAQPGQYDRDLREITATKPAELPEETWQGHLHEIRETIGSVRKQLRRMGRRCSIPIEPAAQTALLDACCSLPGVLGGVVPGAGGYDAIALLVADDTAVLERLRSHCESWKGDPDEESPKEVTEVRVLGVREDSRGVRAEKVEDYKDYFL